MCLFLDEACSWAEKLFTDINLPPLMVDEDNNFGGSLVLDLRKLWHHVQPKNIPHKWIVLFARVDWLAHRCGLAKYYSPPRSRRKKKGFCRDIVSNKVTLWAASYPACVVYTKTIIHRDIWKQELQLRVVVGFHVFMGLFAGFASGTERDTGSRFLRNLINCYWPAQKTQAGRNEPFVRIRFQVINRNRFLPLSGFVKSIHYRLTTLGSWDCMSFESLILACFAGVQRPKGIEGKGKD